MNIRFGPSGVPIQCKGSSSLEGIKCCSELGLDAMELQFGMGVRMKKDSAEEIKEISQKLDISISCHAPYFVNLCSEDKRKIGLSKANLLKSGEIMQYAGGNIFVFHPGFYQTLTKQEAYKNALKNLKKTKEKFDENNIKVKFGAETVGKKTSFGGLDEIIKLSQELDFIKLVIDFAHIHARNDFKLTNEDDYIKLFDKLDKELPGYTDEMHCHFSEINYTDKGERSHYILGTNNEPPYKPLMKVLKEQGYKGTIICETPNLDIDAITMQKYYKKVKK